MLGRRRTRRGEIASLSEGGGLTAEAPGVLQARPPRRGNHPTEQCHYFGVVMKLGAISAAIVSSLMLAALAFADAAPTANKWRIELDGQALKTGDIQFRVTPRQGESTDSR